MLILAILLVMAGEMAVEHQERSLQPGEVVLLRVSGSASRPSGRAFDKPLSFFQSESEGEWMALAGIDLDVAPGRHAIEIEGDSIDLQVQPKEFPTRQLTVDPKYVEPPPETLQRIQREAQLLKRIFESVTAERLWSGAFQRPVPGRANSSFGKRSIFNGKPRSPHSGADLQADQGTPVHAPNNGKVVLAQNLYFSGNTVILDHGQGLYSTLAHLSEFKVEEGQDVATGDVLGLVGATGRVTGPHLHWSVRLNDARVDPFSLMAVSEDLTQSRKAAKP